MLPQPYVPDANINAAAPAGGWTIPSFDMAATARAVARDCRIQTSRLSAYPIKIAIVMEIV
jgi:hypothetical protein